MISAVNKPAIVKNLRDILGERYSLGPGKNVLLIYDGSHRRMSAAISQAARELGATTKRVFIPDSRFSDNLNSSISRALEGQKPYLAINAIEARADELQARIKLLKDEDRTCEYVGHAVGIRDEMLKAPIDYKKMIDQARQLKEKLEGASWVGITTGLGTCLSMNVDGRKIFDDVLPGSKRSNIPFGEVFCAPIEDRVFGDLIADGSATNFGLLPKPIKFKIEAGRIVKMNWLDDAPENDLLREIRKDLFRDEGARIVGEFGVGVAPFPLCGTILTDEKADGTIHIAFGNNKMMGGKNESSSHIDFLVRTPDVFVDYYDGRNEEWIIREGKLII